MLPTEALRIIIVRHLPNVSSDTNCVAIRAGGIEPRDIIQLLQTTGSDCGIAACINLSVQGCGHHDWWNRQVDDGLLVCGIMEGRPESSHPCEVRCGLHDVDVPMQNFGDTICGRADERFASLAVRKNVIIL